MNETNQNIEPYGLIYKTTNLINNKIYIGQTTNIENGYKGKYFGSGILINKAIKKYGFENFKCEFICYANNQSELNNLEIKYIKEFNSLVPNGYNLEDGGKQGGKIHESTKQKLKNRIVVKDSQNNILSVFNHDPRWLSGELKSIHKNHIKSNSTIALLKNKVAVKDKNGNTFSVNKNDPRYVSGELVGVNKNVITAKHSITGEIIQISKDDPKWISGEYIGIMKGTKASKESKEKMKMSNKNKWLGRKHTKETKAKISKSNKDTITVKDPKTGEKFRVHKTDPRWINKELVGIRSKLII